MYVSEAMVDLYGAVRGQPLRVLEPALGAGPFVVAGVWRDYVRQDPKFLRPAEVDLLIGDPTKAREKLGWEPDVDFPTLVKMMVTHDLQREATKAGIPLPG